MYHPSARRFSRTVVLVAVTLAVSAVPLSAQIRVGDDGRLNEANNRVGSGGYNTAPRNLRLVSPNDIALGNVTSGQGFRGNLTGDPSQPFGGRSNLPSERFLRRASAGSVPGAPPLPAGSNARPFYSSTSVGRPPGDFVLNPYTGTYQANVQPGKGIEDLQFGLPPGTPVIRPGADGSQQIILPASISDGQGGMRPAMLTGTPLLGVRPVPTLSDEDRFLIERSTDPRRSNEPPLDPATLRRLREELRQTMVNDPRAAEQFRELSEQERLAESRRTGALSSGTPLEQRPLGMPLNSASGTGGLAGGPVGSGLSPLDGSGGASGASRNVASALTLPALPEAPSAPGRLDPLPGSGAAERNPLLAELRRIETQRAEAARAEAGRRGPGETAPGGRTPRPTDAPERPVRRAPGNTTQPADATAGGNVPPLPNDPNIPINGGQPNVGYVPPIKVGSIAQRQTSAGLRELLQGGETLLAQGRYASAADRFETATRFAPGDATIVVARFHAELGAGFFARAEGSLRQAVSNDASVLGAQYDLRQYLGGDRVDQLIADLKRIAVDDKKAAMPIILLAYLAYNSGDEPRAALLLIEAGERSPRDTLVKAMAARWTRNERQQK